MLGKSDSVTYILFAIEKISTDMGVQILGSEDIDLFGIYYGTSAFYQYIYWPRPGENIDPEKISPLVNYYQFLDKQIGRVISHADENTTVILMSDHGCCDFQRNDFPGHKPDAMVIFAGKNIKNDVRIVNASILDITPTILYLLGLPIGRDMDGRVIEIVVSDEFLDSYPIRFVNTHEDFRFFEKKYEDPLSNEDEFFEIIGC